MKWFQKILSLLLVISLLCSSASVTVFADEVEHVSNIMIGISGTGKVTVSDSNGSQVTENVFSSDYTIGEEITLSIEAADGNRIESICINDVPVHGIDENAVNFLYSYVIPQENTSISITFSSIVLQEVQETSSDSVSDLVQDNSNDEDEEMEGSSSEESTVDEADTGNNSLDGSDDILNDEKDSETTNLNKDEIVNGETEVQDDTEVIKDESQQQVDENSNTDDVEVSESADQEEEQVELYYPINVPVYGDYETGVAPMALDEYTTGSVSTYKRLDMFNPNADDGYQILQMGIKYFSSDNNSADANYLGLKRVIYCMEYAKATPGVGVNMSYTYNGNNAYRPELYVMANGVRYLNQGCTNAYFSTGLGADYDYYVTQIALHLVRGEFSYNYFRERMLSARNKIPLDVKNKVLDCIWNLYNHAVNITTDPNMFYIYGSDNKNYMVYSSNGSTHSLEGVSSVWTQNSDGVWCSPWAAPMSKDYYGGDLRPFYRGISVTTDTSGVFAHVAYENGGPVAQGYHLYIGDSRYKELQRTGATITVTVKLSLPNAFAGRMLHFSANNAYQDVEYFGTLTDWGNNEVILNAKYTIPKVIQEGKLYLQKSSSDTSITDGNSCYSLENAKYGVYSDSSCTTLVAELITNGNGTSNTVELDIGTYYVKEISAPKGYALDQMKYTVNINSTHASSAYVLKVEDEPEMDPVGVLIKKVDADTMEPVPQGAGSTLAGAEFTVKYYDIITDTNPADTGKLPIRTWIIKTDGRGIAYLREDMLVSGDEFYVDSMGIPTLPLGTVTIQETKAPEGYLLNEETFIIPITADGSADNVSTYQIPIIPEPSFKLNLKKVQEGTEIAIPGAVFEHTRPSGETETMTTDEDGNLSFLGLEYGTHTVKEISAPDGYQVNENVIEFTVYEDNTVIVRSQAVISDTSGNVTVTVDEDGNVDVLVEEKVVPYSVQILKKNNKAAILPEVEFTLYEDETCTKIIQVKKTDSNGMLTLDNLMIGKKYFLKETKAPVGYKLPANDPVYRIYAEACPVDGLFDFYINDNKYTVNDTDASKTVYLSGDVTDRLIHFEISNTIGYLLPETGSNGTIVLIMIGSLFMICALLPEDIKSKLRKGLYLTMKNKFLISLLTFSLIFGAVSPFVGAADVQAATYIAESGVANCGNGSASITIYGNEGQSLVGKKFNIYRLFNAENSVGGESINYTFNDTYKQALQNIVGARIYKTPATVTEYDVIDYIQTLNNNKVEGAHTVQALEGRYSEFRYFVEILRDEIVRLGCDSDVVTVDSVNSYNSFQMTGLQYGYYIVDEVTATDGTNAASSLCMVTTSNPTASINIKSDRPTVTKKIQEDDTDEWSDIADFEIGQTVPYKYTSNIPNINGYATYYYAWHDVMDEALTLDKDSVSIVISDSAKSYTLVADEFKLTEKPDASTTFKIEIMDIKSIVDREFNQKDSLGHNTYGQTVTVTYNATLNDKAAEDTGRPGFENDVRLEFSNNPDIIANGNPEDETGFTPWDTVVSFTYKLDVLKTNDKDLPLANAKFRLYSDEECTNEVYVKNSANGYIVINRDSVGGTDHTGGNTPSDAVEMISDDEGKFTIFGLDDGLYYLKETDAPDGYRQILDPIKLTVDATYTTEVNDYIKGDGATDKTLEALDITADIKLFLEGKYEESTNDLVTDVETGSGNLTVINHVGSKLPVTGSFGTIALIALGSGAMLFGMKKEDEE